MELVQIEPAVPTRRQLREAGIRILVAVPMERTIISESFPYLWSIARRGWELLYRPYDRTDNNRNAFAEALLEHAEYTHICMLDLDELHPEDTIERLARWVLEDPGRLIVSGLSFRRGTPFDPLAMLYDAEGGAHSIAGWDAPLVQVDVIGHGAVLIHRSVFETLQKPWWAYTYQGGRAINPSEDMFFCRNCKAAGIGIYVDTTCKTQHLITSVVDEDTFRAYIAEHPDEITEV